MAMYEIKQGDHISGIAYRFGFSDYKTIWNHPNNADLKKKRINPHVLFPGDLLFVPDKESKDIDCPTDQQHSFRLSGQPLKIRLALKDFDNEPIAGAECVLEVGSKVYNLTSDGEGIIETPIPKDAKSGTLRVPSLGLERSITIGHLDPEDEDSGYLARLVNLGYFSGTPDQTEALRHAIEEFQCDHKLKVTGELDAATRAKIKSIHGV